MNRREMLFGLLIATPFFLLGCGKKAEHEADPKEVKEFFDAVNDGDADIVARLLKAKPYLANVKNESGQTPLTVAKQRNNEELVDAIKKAGGN